MSCKIAIILGSKSDVEKMQSCLFILNKAKQKYDLYILSAHRNPDKVRDFAVNASKKGYKVIIAAAGMAAALPGVVAAYTDLPVIGVPIKTSTFKGIDSLLSIIQMPSGVPVGTVAVGEAGVKNSALLALRILGLLDSDVLKKMKLVK